MATFSKASAAVPHTTGKAAGPCQKGPPHRSFCGKTVLGPSCSDIWLANDGTKASDKLAPESAIASLPRPLEFLVGGEMQPLSENGYSKDRPTHPIAARSRPFAWERLHAFYSRRQQYSKNLTELM